MHIRPQQLQPRRTVCRFDHGVTQLAQYIGEQHAYGGFVVDQQHGFAVLGDFDVHLPWGQFVTRGGAVVAWEVEGHAGAFAFGGVQVHLAAGLLGEAVDHGQAQAGALADGFGGEEGFEHVGHDVGGHAGAGVGDAQAQVGAFGQVVGAGGGGVEPVVAGLQLDAAALGHGVAGVDAQIEQGVFQLADVDEGGPGISGAGGFDLDAGAGGALDEFGHAVHQGVDVGGARFQGLPAREGQQTLGEDGGAFGRALGGDHVFVHIGQAALGDAAVHQFQRAGDAGEQVVEVVGQAAGELANGFHFLRLAQFFFGLHEQGGAFGDTLFQGFVEGAQFSLGVAQGFVGDGAFQQVGGLAGEDVEQAQVAFGRLVRRAPVGGDHAEQAPVAGQQRGGLGRADASVAEGLQVVGAGDVGPFFEVGDDGALAQLQGHGATAVGHGAHPLPEPDRFRWQAARTQQLQLAAMAGRVAFGAQQLHGAELRAGDGHGGVDDLAVEGFEVLLADQVEADAVQEFDVRQGGFRVAGGAQGESGREGGA